MKKEERRLLSVLRAVIDDKYKIDFSWQDLTEAEQIAIIEFSKWHEVTAMVADYALKQGVSADQSILSELKEQYYRAKTSYIRQTHTLNKCTDIFQREEIPYILLKGCVLRQYYPEPCLRTSADIDILVPKEHYERAITLMKSQHSIKQTNETPHDTAFRSSQGAHIEIHRFLIESGRIGRAEKQLDDVWKTASLKSGLEYEMSDEMFYYYHLAHMAKHIERGGCGIRPFIDLWLLNHRVGENPRREELLQQGGLKKFADAATLLSECWFGSSHADEKTALFERFVLDGGAFGSKQNEVKVKAANRNGRMGYLMYKTWMPYPYLCMQYPSLKGKRALQPYYELRRWMRIIFKGNVRYGTQEIKLVSQLSPEMKDTEEMWQYLGF